MLKTLHQEIQSHISPSIYLKWLEPKEGISSPQSHLMAKAWTQNQRSTDISV